MELERPLAAAHHAGGQALLGRPARAEAHAAALPGLPARLPLPARALPALPRAPTSSGCRRAAAASSTPSRSRYQTFSKAFKVKPPYVLAMIELEEGPRMMSNLIGIEPDPEADPLRHARARSSSRSSPTRSRCRCSSPREVRDEGAPELASASSAPTRATSSARCPTRACSRCTSRRCATPCATPASRSATWTASSRRASTRRRRSARRSASCRATSTAPRWAAARSSSWWATPCVALHHGLCDVAVVCHGESGRSGVGVTPRRDTALPGQYEMPYGFGGAPTLLRHDHHAAHARVRDHARAVGAGGRLHARVGGLNPKARNREPITVADVLNSRPVCYPFNLLNICLVTDAGGAVVLTRADRAKDCAKKPVYVRGAGEATEHVMLTQMKNLTHQRGHAPLRRQGASRWRASAPGTSTTSCSTTPSRRGRRSCSSRSASASPARACSFFEHGQVDPGRHAAHQHQRGRPLVHALRHVRHLPDHRGRAPAARRVRRAPGARRQAVARQRHGRHALGGGHARPVARAVRGAQRG